jgi:hypothetical protein
MCRWLAHMSDWGTLSTADAASGLPYGGVVSVSDGPSECPTGRLLFYLTVRAAARPVACVAAALGCGCQAGRRAGGLNSRQQNDRRQTRPQTSHPVITPNRPNPPAPRAQTQPMDATTKNLDASPDGASALVLAEASQLPGGCGGPDPESPVCAKVTVVGGTRPVGDEGVEEAMGMLVARHPEMGERGLNRWLAVGWLAVGGVRGGR